MTQTEYQRAALGESQEARILCALVSHIGEWVAMPELAQVYGVGAGHSRVSDLRKRGHNIEHRNERSGRVVKSFYRLSV